MPQVVYCLDIGSVSNNNFIWARRGLQPVEEEVFCGASLSRVVDRIKEDLAGQASIALGLECPLFLLQSMEIEDLGGKRKADLKERSVVSGPAATSALTGMQQLLYVLEQVKASTVQAGVDLTGFVSQRPGLYLWEAFVGKDAATKAEGLHYMDAVTAIAAFSSLAHKNQLGLPEEQREEAVLSLVGAALLRSGLAQDPGILKVQPLVIRPQSPAEAIGGHPARLAYDGRNAGYLILSSELLQPLPKKR
jgi:hypothetical protein